MLELLCSACGAFCPNTNRGVCSKEESYDADCVVCACCGILWHSVRLGVGAGDDRNIKAVWVAGKLVHGQGLK